MAATKTTTEKQTAKDLRNVSTKGAEKVKGGAKVFVKFRPGKALRAGPN
jgi:nucleoid DNA-binding protein